MTKNKYFIGETVYVYIHCESLVYPSMCKIKIETIGYDKNDGVIYNGSYPESWCSKDFDGFVDIAMDHIDKVYTRYVSYFYKEAKKLQIE